MRRWSRPIDSNENQLHAQILRHGMLSWVTRGVFLGYQRNYYEMQVDDVFLPDARWSTTLKRSLVDGPTAAPDETQCDPGARHAEQLRRRRRRGGHDAAGHDARPGPCRRATRSA